MKYIKQFITIIIFGILLINIQSVQAQIINPPEIGNVTIEIPEKLKSPGVLFKEQSLNERLSSGHIWGNSRFSIGLWIGGDATPTRFAHQPGGNKGRIILHAEGVLLSSRDPLKHPKHYYEPPKGDPAQIQNCPICGNLLSFPKDKPLGLTGADVAWIIKTSKSIGQLESIPQTNYQNSSNNQHAASVLHLHRSLHRDLHLLRLQQVPRHGPFSSRPGKERGGRRAQDQRQEA